MTVQLGSMEFELPLEDSLLIRTDFSDDDAWRAVCREVSTPTPDDGFVGYFVFVDEQVLDGATVDSLIALMPEQILYVADARTMTDPEHPILVVECLDLNSPDSPRRSFRVIPSAAWGPENNLSLGNMDFESFADAVDDDGVFRDWPATS